MILVLTSFLPPTHTHLYIQPLVTIWEAFNSGTIDDRLMDMWGDLAEEHVAGIAGNAGEEGGAAWKDVGIWTAAQGNRLIGKGLGSMSMIIKTTPIATRLIIFRCGAMRVIYCSKTNIKYC